MQSQSFPLLPVFGGRVLPTPPFSPVVRPKIVVDAISGFAWKARTLFISVSAPVVDFLAQREIGTTTTNPQQTAVAGVVVFELEGLHPGGTYFRRFNLGTFDQIRIPIETFKDIRLRVMDQTGSGFSVLAIATDELTITQTPPEVYLVTQDLGAGTRLVPPGAVSLITRQADPLFSWVDLIPPQIETTFPEAVFAGVPLEVRGTTYRTTVATLDILWRIRL